MRLPLVCLFLLSLTVWSCQDESPVDDEYIRISDNEQQLLDDCSAAPIIDSLAIAQNVIGDWELVGFACNFCISVSDVFASITIKDDSTGLASYQDETFSESINFSWDIRREVLQGDTTYYLITEPARSYLTMTDFCEAYMFRNSYLNDGGLFLFEKQ
ncbi:MAG TPA: hypothetical protein VJ953_10035 [Saprospiraceae bacterium]|nr:hypothetical protein [Saprospiraceae bacterium]